MKEEKVHLVFKSKETGRFLFHVMYPKREFDLVEQAAKSENISVEEFILSALERYLNIHEDSIRKQPDR